MKRHRVVKRRPVNQSKLAIWRERLKPANIKAFVFSREGAKFFLKLFGAGFLLLFLLLLYFAKDLPSPNKINSIINAQSTRFYDRTGQTVLYEVYGNKNRTVVDFNQIPDSIKHATVAVEDKDFYKHGAFSTIGILRAAFVDLFCHCGLQGGSTITQQYVKNALLTDNQTFSRKIKELILSIEIESFYSKNDILKLYLNEIPYGSNAYGVEAACRTYFNYHGTTDCAQKLTLDEAAFLAAIPRAPTYYSPYGSHTDDLITRKNLILDLMQQQGYASQADIDAAKKTDTLAHVNPVQNLYANITAPHFVLYVEQLLEDKYGVATVTEGGLKVITTLDLHQQQLAEQAITSNMKHVQAAGGSNAALVSADPTNGEVLSMVGSYNFSDTKFGAFNVATAQRQPGSSFKPFVYATGFGQNYNFGPGSTLYNVVTDFGGGYKPLNFPGDPASPGRPGGSVESVRSSLGNSLNIPAVKMLYLVGVKQAIDQAHKMGITTLNDDPGNYGLSLVLGSGEVKLVDMVNAYESFANLGVHYDQVYVLKITDSKGTTLEEYKPTKVPTRVLDPQVAYLMNNVLADINAKRPAFSPDLSYFTFPGHTVAAKTGTTENFGDAWTMGYSPNLVTGVWVGNNDNTPMHLAAADVAAPIFHTFMSGALAGTPNQTWQQPAGIKQVTLDANTGRLPALNAKGPTRTDLFPSWYKPPAATDTRSAQVDSVSGKLATQCTPPLAIQTVYASEMHSEIPANDPAYSRWEPPVQALAQTLGYQAGGQLPTENDNVHSCSDTKPTVSLATSPNPDGSFHLVATWSSGTFQVNKLDVKLDDQIISTQTAGPSGSYAFDSDPVTSGAHTFRAIVTDTGLYQSEDDQTVNGSGSGGGGGSLQTTYPGSGAAFGFSPSGSLTFRWNGNGAGLYHLVVKKSGLTIVDIQTGATQYSAPSAQFTPGTYTWTVQTTLPAATSPVSTFTVN